MSRYREFLKGKKVILVGPSPSIINQNIADYIDSFDVVVRLNRAIDCLDSVSEYVGKRVDVLYNCLHQGNLGGGDINVEEWYRRRIPWICSPYPEKDFTIRNINHFRARNKNRLNFHMFDLGVYDQLETKLGTRPNSGTLAIIDLLSSDLKELVIVGMTFGLDGYYSQYENITAEQYKQRADSGNHAINPQLEYVRDNIYGKDSRFKPNDILKKLLRK